MELSHSPDGRVVLLLERPGSNFAGSFSPMAVYVGLFAFPEVITKGVASALGVALATWLGVETVW